jgi:hypothetical protein
MSSSDNVPTLQETQRVQNTQETPSKESSGKTFWDVFYKGRFVILVTLIAIGIIVAIYYSATFGDLDVNDIGPMMTNALEQAYPAIIFFAVGFIVMRHILFNVYRPASRYVFVTNAEDQVCGLFRIPEPRFKTMNQPGNPLVFKTISGTLIYFARYIDIDSNEIGYGWCHIDKFEIVAADRALFAKIETDFQWLLERVMYLEGHLEVESAYKARGPMGKMVEDIASRFGLRKRREYFGFDNLSATENPPEDDDSGGIIR